jgi:predicted transcriptional regulator
MIEIRIFATERERRRALHHLVGGKDISAGARTTILLTPEHFQTVFSPERLRIILILKEGPVTSISTLAQRLQRSFEAVHRDIKTLASYGLVTLRKVDRRVIPTLAGRITVPISA